MTFEIASYDSEKLNDDQYNEENKSCRGIDSFLKWRQQILEDVEVDVGRQEKSDLETKFFTRCNWKNIFFQSLGGQMISALFS